MSAPVTRFPNTAMMTGGVFLVVGLLLLGALGMNMGRDVMIEAAFIGWMFWTCVTFGCFGLSLLHHTVRGKWGAPLLRLWEAGGGWINIVVTGVIGLVLLNFGKDVLYPWMTPEGIAADPVLAGRGPWHTSAFTTARYAFYFGLPALWAWWNQRWLQREEATGEKRWSDLRTNFSAPGIAMFVLVINFWATDVGMALDEHWFSQIYGIWFVGKMALMALSMATLILCTQAAKAPYAGKVTPGVTKDLGNLLFAFTMLWGYFSLSQFLIIWSPDLPEFTSYYLARSNNGYNVVGMVNLMGSFFIPFLALLSPAMKRSTKTLGFWAGWIFTFTIVDMFYVLLPSLQPTNWIGTLGVMFGGVALFGGIWHFLFAWRVRQAKSLLTEPHPYKAMEEKAHAAA